MKVIYEWKAWEGYLLQSIFPEALRLKAVIGETSKKVLSRLPKTTEQFYFHINCTRSIRFPVDRRTMDSGLSRYAIPQFNSRVHDISKRYIQEVCVREKLPSTAVGMRGDPSEKLIVKTNENFGGWAERELGPSDRTLLEVPKPTSVIRNAYGYVVRRRDQIPRGWWTNPRLAIEKFVSNQENLIYRVYVAGSSLVITASINPETIKKMTPGLPRKNLLVTGKVPSETELSSINLCVTHYSMIVKFIAAVSLDFGTLDIVRDDHGELFVVDVNTTPYWGAESYPEIISHLREGLDKCLIGRNTLSGPVCSKGRRDKLVTKGRAVMNRNE